MITDKQLTLLTSLFYMTVIDAQSFIDEYEEVFGIKTGKDFFGEVFDCKKINKPLIAKIKEWKDLKDFRNHLLAQFKKREKTANLFLVLEIFITMHQGPLWICSYCRI